MQLFGCRWARGESRQRKCDNVRANNSNNSNLANNSKHKNTERRIYLYLIIKYIKNVQRNILTINNRISHINY